MSTQSSFPLSPMQQGMLFRYLVAPESGIDIEQLVVNCREELDIPALFLAWERTVARHEALRTIYHWKGRDEPLQEVVQSPELQWGQHYWAALSAKEQQERAQAFLQSDRLQGFDLSEAPPMRLALFILGHNHWRLVWTFHHIMIDGYSLRIVLREVFDLYKTTGQSCTPPVPYREYINWLSQQDWTVAESYWRRSLQGFIAPTPLMSCRESASGLEKTFDIQEIKILKGLTQRLIDFSNEYHLTVNTLLQAAWAVLLSRYSREEDVLFGAVRRNRYRDFLSTVGLLINTIPVRVRVNPELSIITWLQEVRNQWVEQRDYGHVPLTKIQELSELTGGTPLFENILVFEDMPLATTVCSFGSEWENRKCELHEQPGYPLAIAAYLEFANNPELIHLRIKAFYDCRRFDGATVERMLGHLKVLVANIVADPSQKVSQLPLLTASERHTLLVDWNQTQAYYPTDKCVHELFEEQVERSPEEIAIVFNDQRLTYREVNIRANQLARYLVSTGVQAETVVGVCMRRSPEMLIAILGVLKAGGAYLPIDPSYPQERIDFILDDAGAKILLRDPILGNGNDEDLSNLHRPVTSSNLAYVIYTSGSTGKPKGTEIEHKSLLNLIYWHQKAFQVSKKDRATQLASPAFDASVWEIWPYLTVGASIHIPDEETRLTPGLLKAWLIESGITVTFVPTPIAENLLSLDWSESLALRIMTTGGDRLTKRPPEDLPFTFVNNYGPTENTVVATSGVVASKNDLAIAPHIGKPIDNVQVYLLDEHMQLVPVGVAGEIYIGGLSLARGYRNHPELTMERFICNPFSEEFDSCLYKTGDLARYLSDGNIEFLGRTDYQIKIRGYRIELGEIEAVLAQAPDVKGSAVTLEDGLLVAYLICSGFIPHLSDLRSFLGRRLPTYMMPSRFVFLDALPLTPNGKVDRKALAAMEKPSGLDSNDGYVAPATEMEKAIALIFQQILSRETVGVNDNFFEIGGNSLLVMKLYTQIQKQFNSSISITELFEYTTVYSLAARLTQGDFTPSDTSNRGTERRQATRQRVRTQLDEDFR